MGWTTKILLVISLLAALHNWDLLCGPQVCRGMTSGMEITYMKRAAFCLFIAVILILYEVNIYFASRKDEEFEP